MCLDVRSEQHVCVCNICRCFLTSVFVCVHEWSAHHGYVVHALRLETHQCDFPCWLNKHVSEPAQQELRSNRPHSRSGKKLEPYTGWITNIRPPSPTIGKRYNPTRNLLQRDEKHFGRLRGLAPGPTGSIGVSFCSC